MVGRQGIPAGTAVWINHSYPGVKVGTAAVTLTDCERDSHGESVQVRLENGKEQAVTSSSLSSMLAEEIPAWVTDRPSPAPLTSQGGN